LALPGTKSYLIHAGQGGSLHRIAHRPNLFLFTASAYKTFVLGQYLRDVEAGLLAEDEQLAIDDSVRMISSPVFLNLVGTTTARSVLEAMITYSDNTATDLATGKVGADRVRAPIAQAGLSSIRIPTPRAASSPTSSVHPRAWTWAGRGSCRPRRIRPNLSGRHLTT